ncbi:CRISPR-associated protein Cas2 [Thermovibrio ammonificans HB-1]|uniref:CRISPR-associated endoribonuclease Cas2 n=1 Tax=Thermovibrio ammonificans (strain DSM 15698 / JCM 12110 / HB-1) TaxID=648996 RepID=E8T546_THEA1|nr:CRISPR-associated protein Cas2 [Thermovibrio ammonificans HB-1]
MIVVYDVEVSRVDRVRKLLRRYLNWVQNSVFEGEITVSRLTALKKELQELLKENDSVYIYTVKFPKAVKRETVGAERGGTEEFL